jgi:hypothetical protein
MAHARTCRACGGRMTEGRLINTDSYGGHKVPRWTEGVPERSYWTGLKVNKRDLLPVISYRCERCGLLEDYAQG